MKLSQLASAPHNEHGPAPAYSGIDVARAFWAVGNHEPISRLDLSNRLLIGEGSTRSVITALEEMKLVTIVKRGCTLTEEGSEKFRELKRSASAAQVGQSPASFNHPACGILLRSMATRISDVLKPRDAAVRNGALGATIMIVDGNRLLYAGAEKHAVDEESARRITAALNPGNGDAVVLGYSPEKLFAERGAWAAATEITG